MVMMAVTRATTHPTPARLKAGQAVEFFSEAETAARRSSSCS